MNFMKIKHMEHILDQEPNRKWAEEGEKNTKYFLNLEKKHQINNKISCIQDENGNKHYNTKDILKEGARFYQKLYSKQNISPKDIDKFLDKITINKSLNDEEAEILESEISEFECTNVVNKLSKNKSPGMDGLTGEFYKTFWKDIKKLVIDSFNEAFINGELSETHKQIIISLIFKKGERFLLKNYRPLSLSNVDYKILAFVLAKRLQAVIAKLLSPEQVAYIEQRFIGQNVRLLLDVIEYAKKSNKPGLLLFIDFEKAFDSLDWTFIEKCLKKFGFKDNFCKWIQIIYTEPKAFLKVNGFFSETINIQRGIRQGCPISCLVFILCTEFLSAYLNQATEFKGFSIDTEIGKTTIKITQYADDTCLFLNGIEQIDTCTSLINDFTSVSGLKLNLDKTEGYCIGALAEQSPDVPNIKWPKTHIKYLGIYFGQNQEICERLNFKLKVEEMQKLIDSWRTRKLTLQGKITILKTLAMPKLVYAASLLPVPETTIKEINKIFYKYLWGKSDKVQRHIMINNYDEGGLNMIDVESHVWALKAAWLPRIFNDLNDKWKHLPFTT